MWEYKFEYVRVGIHQSGHEKEYHEGKAKIAELGKHGWEAVSMVPAAFQDSVVVVLFKKRMVQVQEWQEWKKGE